MKDKTIDYQITTTMDEEYSILEKFFVYCAAVLSFILLGGCVALLVARNMGVL